MVRKPGFTNDVGFSADVMIRWNPRYIGIHVHEPHPPLPPPHTPGEAYTPSPHWESKIQNLKACNSVREATEEMDVSGADFLCLQSQTYRRSESLSQFKITWPFTLCTELKRCMRPQPLLDTHQVRMLVSKNRTASVPICTISHR